MSATNNPPSTSLKQMIALRAWSASPYRLWMTRLVWKHFLNSCSGVQPWSVLVRKTQITAWWVWTLCSAGILQTWITCVRAFLTNNHNNTTFLPWLQRDFGSVMVCDDQLQGLQWYDNGCFNSAHPTVYTKLCKYNDWIDDVMNRYTTTQPTSTTAA